MDDWLKNSKPDDPLTDTHPASIHGNLRFHDYNYFIIFKRFNSA